MGLEFSEFWLSHRPWISGKLGDKPVESRLASFLFAFALQPNTAHSDPNSLERLSPNGIQMSTTKSGDYHEQKHQYNVGRLRKLHNIKLCGYYHCAQ